SSSVELGLVEDLGRRAAAEPIALVPTFGVVVAEVAIEHMLQILDPHKVRAPTGRAPALGQYRPLQALDEAVGPGLPRPELVALDAQLAARPGEDALEFTAADDGDAPERVAGRLVRGADHLPQDSGGAVRGAVPRRHSDT